MADLNLFAILLIIFGILQIILFFKLWIMTNDVAEIKNFLKGTASNNNIKGQNAIVLKTGEEVEVLEITNGKFRCVKPNTNAIVGLFSKEELQF